MLAGNGKLYLYDTASMDVEDSDGPNFLQMVQHYAEHSDLRLVVSAAADIRRGFKKAIQAKAEAYIKTVRLCPAVERAMLAVVMAPDGLAVAAGRDS